jgi:hypothetical protein
LARVMASLCEVHDTQRKDHVGLGGPKSLAPRGPRHRAGTPRAVVEPSDDPPRASNSLFASRPPTLVCSDILASPNRASTIAACFIGRRRTVLGGSGDDPRQ